MKKLPSIKSVWDEETNIVRHQHPRVSLKSKAKHWCSCGFFEQLWRHEKKTRDTGNILMWNKRSQKQLKTTNGDYLYHLLFFFGSSETFFPAVLKDCMSGFSFSKAKSTLHPTERRASCRSMRSLFGNAFRRSSSRVCTIYGVGNPAKPYPLLTGWGDSVLFSELIPSSLVFCWYA